MRASVAHWQALEHFASVRPSANPTANDGGRSSAPSNLVLTYNRDVSDEARAAHLCLFREDADYHTRGLMPVRVQVKAPLMHACDCGHPVLLNPRCIL